MPVLTPDDRSLIMDLTQGRVTTDEFAHGFTHLLTNPPDTLTFILQTCEEQGDSDDIEHVLLFGYAFDAFQQKHAVILAKLLLQDHHRSHENLARTLQDLRHPATLHALTARCGAVPAYLAELDDGNALFRKCAWAIHDIGTQEAKTALRWLAQHGQESLREFANKRLNEWNPARRDE